MTNISSPFTLRPVATKELKRIAISVRAWLQQQPNRFDLAIHFPLSQAIDPTSRAARQALMGSQFHATIPLAILTPFPKGKLLAAVFDRDSEDLLITELLKKTGIKVITKEIFSDLTRGDIRDALKSEKKSKPYERESVGYQQFQAYKIIAERLNYLDQFDSNQYIILHEVRASSIATIKPEDIHSNNSSWVDIWNHAKQTSFDCLVVTKDDMYPLLAIEFDGDGHSQGNYESNDALKNGYCNKLSLPLIRINECYLDNGDTWLHEFSKEFFRQGLIFELLIYADRKHKDYLEFKQKFSDFSKKQRAINPSAASKYIAIKYLSDEETLADEFVSAQAEEWEKEHICNEYRSIYKADPEIQFTVDKLERISACITVPIVGSKKALTFDCPAAIKAEIFGINKPDIESLIKNYMRNFLLDRAISVGICSSVSSYL